MTQNQEQSIFQNGLLWILSQCPGFAIFRCCYHLGRYKEARKYLENAIKLDKTQPLSWFYGAANMDALGKRNGAMDGYKRYLKLNHDNPEMNAFARKRLDDLRKKRKSDWKSQLLKVIDAVKKEIEK